MGGGVMAAAERGMEGEGGVDAMAVAVMVEARTVACRAVEVVLADAAVDGQGLATAAAAVWAVGVLVMAAEAVIPVSMRLADPRSLSLESRRACATLAR